LPRRPFLIFMLASSMGRRHAGRDLAIAPFRLLKPPKLGYPVAACSSCSCSPRRLAGKLPTSKGAVEGEGKQALFADLKRKPQEARMEIDQRSSDRLPFHDPQEAVAPYAGAPSRDARIRHLQRVPLFSGLTEDELRRVAELSRIAEAPADTVITQIGEPGDSFFVIIDGAVAVRTPVGAGSQLQPGDFFGEMSLLDGEPRSATIVATSDVRLLIVDRSHFWRLLDETPDLVRRILTILSRRVRRLEQAVNTILRGTNPT
jgi:hypothetical protein